MSRHHCHHCLPCPTAKQQWGATLSTEFVRNSEMPFQFKNAKNHCSTQTFRWCFSKGLCSRFILPVWTSPILLDLHLWVCVLPPTVTVISYYFSIHPQVFWTIYWALQALWQYWYIIITLLYICIPTLPSPATPELGQQQIWALPRKPHCDQLRMLLWPWWCAGDTYTEKPSTVIKTYIFISIKAGNISFSAERDSEAHFLIERRL